MNELRYIEFRFVGADYPLPPGVEEVVDTASVAERFKKDEAELRARLAWYERYGPREDRPRLIKVPVE